MKLKPFALIVLLAFALAGCDAVKQVGGAYNFTKCKYEYNSVSNLALAGTDLSKGVSLTSAARVAQLLTAQSDSMPLTFTVNLDVTNPSQSEAFMSGLKYILSIDNVQFTTGAVNRAVSVPASGKAALPLTIGVDVLQLLKGESAEAATRAVKNFIGIGDEKSYVTLEIKPTFTVAGIAVESPAYIPVNFSFGGSGK